MATDTEWQLRLERLEREHKRFRWYAAAAVLLVGIAPYVPRLWRPRAAIEASGFVLRDNDGRVRGRLAFLDTDAFLQLYDSGGGLQAALGAGTNGASLLLYDAHRTMRLGAAAGKHPSISIYDEGGKPLFSAPPPDH